MEYSFLSCDSNLFIIGFSCNVIYKVFFGEMHSAMSSMKKCKQANGRCQSFRARREEGHFDQSHQSFCSLLQSFGMIRG